MGFVTFETIEELSNCIGQEVSVSEWVEVSQEMVNQFAKLTGDSQWIHVDELRAKSESPFGDTVAHGFLTVSLLVKLLEQSISTPFSTMGVNYGFNKLRFTSPVVVGSKLRARFALKEIVEIEGGIQITWSVKMECLGKEKPVLVADWVTRKYS